MIQKNTILPRQTAGVFISSDKGMQTISRQFEGADFVDTLKDMFFTNSFILSHCIFFKIQISIISMFI